ncbi:hypothetical protein niasHT_038880 [Heterodera trifolii]|uniref:Uncharacterized protein n=1 Tax=Heterodera trifolii TaxID=157864 RepID=A0ABD2ILX5_9BILA
MDEIKQIVEQICAKKGINEQGKMTATFLNGQTLAQKMQKTSILGQKVLEHLKLSGEKQPKVPLDNFGTQLMAFANGLPNELPGKSAVIKQLEPINGSLATPNDVMKFLINMVSDSANKQVNGQENFIGLMNASARRHRRFDRRLLPIAVVIQLIFFIGCDGKLGADF